jgi:hypothetical protein
VCVCVCALVSAAAADALRLDGAAGLRVRCVHVSAPCADATHLPERRRAPGECRGAAQQTRTEQRIRCFVLVCCVCPDKHNTSAGGRHAPPRAALTGLLREAGCLGRRRRPYTYTSGPYVVPPAVTVAAPLASCLSLAGSRWRTTPTCAGAGCAICACVCACVLSVCVCVCVCVCVLSVCVVCVCVCVCVCCVCVCWPLAAHAPRTGAHHTPCTRTPPPRAAQHAAHAPRHKGHHKTGWCLWCCSCRRCGAACAPAGPARS